MQLDGEVGPFAEGEADGEADAGAGDVADRGPPCERVLRIQGVRGGVEPAFMAIGGAALELLAGTAGAHEDGARLRSHGGQATPMPLEGATRQARSRQRSRPSRASPGTR